MDRLTLIDLVKEGISYNSIVHLLRGHPALGELLGFEKIKNAWTLPAKNLERLKGFLLKDKNPATRLNKVLNFLVLQVDQGKKTVEINKILDVFI